ncbi:hypothetical protein [Arthrobacter methylotrophus]|uniref:hypothetical protein n=1 Tax=Arthrobacter methylotrophus TaxID=121291 RepID=UPI0031F0B577
MTRRTRFYVGLGRFSSVLMRPQWPQRALTCGFSHLDAAPELSIAANFRLGSSVRMLLPTKLGSDLHGYFRTPLGRSPFQSGLTINSP